MLGIKNWYWHKVLPQVNKREGSFGTLFFYA
jgi:hypothetical protein